MRLKKSFSQNFLVDGNYLQKIINQAKLKQDDIILEIGSGSGLLTCLSARLVKKVYAVEIEQNALNLLNKNIKEEELSNIEVVKNDILKLDFENLKETRVKVIGNIPYNITTQILLKLFGEIDRPSPCLDFFDEAYLMMQLEFAERILAGPGIKAYSPISILIQYFAEAKMLFKVPRKAFYPVPRVDSAFVMFKKRKERINLENPTLVKELIRKAFQQRRKKISNSLEEAIGNKKLATEIIETIKLDQNMRAENLKLEDYLRIAKCLNAGN